MPTVVFPPNQLAEAARLYREGHSLKDLMEKYGVSQRQLQNNLDRVGVEYRQGNRKYVTNEHVFDNLTNERAAYWAGFLYADACGIHNTVLEVCISAKDRKHIEKLRDFVSPEHPIYDESYDGYDRVRFQVCGRHLSTRMIELGIIVGRDCLTSPILNLAEPACRHWIRGLFDGDGSATKYGRMNFCGNLKALSFVREVLEEVVGLDSAPYKHQSANAFYLVYHRGYPARLVAEYLYDGATVFLERKQDVILDVWPETSPASVPECK